MCFNALMGHISVPWSVDSHSLSVAAFRESINDKATQLPWPKIPAAKQFA